jgi:hypothetical protein
MEMSLRSVSNNFMSEHKIMWHLKEIILKNIKRYVLFSILNVVFLKCMQSWNLIV